MVMEDGEIYFSRSVGKWYIYLVKYFILFFRLGVLCNFLRRGKNEM